MNSQEKQIDKRLFKETIAAARVNNDAVVRASVMEDDRLLTARGPNDNTLLHIAAANKALDVAEYLVAQGAVRDVENGAGKKALDLAKATGFEPMIKLMEKFTADRRKLDNEVLKHAQNRRDK